MEIFCLLKELWTYIYFWLPRAVPDSNTNANNFHRNILHLPFRWTTYPWREFNPAIIALTLDKFLDHASRAEGAFSTAWGGGASSYLDIIYHNNITNKGTYCFLFNLKFNFDTLDNCPSDTVGAYPSRHDTSSILSPLWLQHRRLRSLPLLTVSLAASRYDGGLGYAVQCDVTLPPIDTIICSDKGRNTYFSHVWSRVASLLGHILTNWQEQQVVRRQFQTLQHDLRTALKDGRLPTSIHKLPKM